MAPERMAWRVVNGQIVFGAATHSHRPITVNGNMTACADCGVIILIPPTPTVGLTSFAPTWPGIEQEQENIEKAAER